MKTNLKIVERNDPVPTPILCREIVAEYKKRQEETQRLVVANPLANQHQEVVKPRLDTDGVLRKSFKDVLK